MSAKRELVAGADSSTQHTKLVVVDLETGELVGSRRRPHPDGSEVDPEHWWTALRGTGAQRLNGLEAIGIAAQQHTTIFLDEANQSIRPALLWNDLRATACARRLRAELSDPAWLEGVGLLPDGTHPVSKLRWLRDQEPHHAARVRSVLLPHDWLTWRLLDGESPASTDRSDASATGYWSAVTESYRSDLIELALGHAIATPEVIAPDRAAGITPNGLVVAAGCGDNAATHLALDTVPGDVVISVGTSTTVSMRAESGVNDPTGFVDSMADVRGGFLHIVAMLNGARVLSATAQMLGATVDELDRLASGADPAAGGMTFLPYLDGERNPPRPPSASRIVGLDRHSMSIGAIARAGVLGLACAIANAVDAVAGLDAPRRALIVGGGARSAQLRQAVADLTGVTVIWPEHREHAAWGAAKQAAWSLTGSVPAWPERPADRVEPATERDWAVGVRARYDAEVARG